MSIRRLKVDDKTYSLIYDDEVYDIFYNYENKKIVIRRKQDNKTVEEFSKNIYFIEQTSRGFIVGEKGKCKAPVITYNYYDFDSNDIYWKDSYRIPSSDIDKVRLSCGVYIIGDDNKKSLFSPELLTRSIEYDRITTNNETSFELNDMVLVDEVISVEDEETHYPVVSDKIKYGVNPVTFKVATKIYSFNQNKFIDVYTDEELMVKDSCPKVPGIICNDARHSYSVSIDRNLDETINDKVIYPLMLQAKQLLKGQKREVVDIDFMKKIEVANNDN